MVLKYIVTEKFTNKHIKEFLLQQGISHRLLLTLKQNNCIFCNDKPVFTNHLINNGDVITLDLNYEEQSDNIVPTPLELDILHEDDCILILNKPAGIPVHPSLHYYTTSLSNGVKYYFDNTGLKKKIRPVNRLDKNTSGIVLFAKNEYVQEELIHQMNTKQFKKEYIAVLDGILTEKKRNNKCSDCKKGKQHNRTCYIF